MMKRERNKISYNYTMDVLQKILIEEGEYGKPNYFLCKQPLSTRTQI